MEFAIFIPGHIGLISENHPGMMVEMLARPVPGFMFSITTLLILLLILTATKKKKKKKKGVMVMVMVMVIVLPLLVLPADVCITLLIASAMTGREPDRQTK